MTKLSSKTKGVFYIILAAFGFSLMSMFVKLAGDLPSFQKAFFRNFIALIFISADWVLGALVHTRKEVTVPDLTKKSVTQALGLLASNNLALKQAGVEFAKEVAPGSVLRQLPSAGSTACSAPELMNTPCPVCRVRRVLFTSTWMGPSAARINSNSSCQCHATE